MLPEFIQKNYDYGQGLYANMDKYDSVRDFLNDQRKKIKKRKKKSQLRKKILKEIAASYQEFTDNYNYIDYSGDFMHGLGDSATPLPDQDGKDVSDPTFGNDIFDPETVIDIELDEPYSNLLEDPGSGVDKEFTDNLEIEENKYYNTQNNGNNIYFYVGSIPTSSDILKE